LDAGGRRCRRAWHLDQFAPDARGECPRIGSVADLSLARVRRLGRYAADEPMRIEDGGAVVPDLRGIGLGWDDDVVARYRLD
jgi:L-alanine-DL-glutamate epimerase-like enolase superfamily enzyme